MAKSRIAEAYVQIIPSTEGFAKKIQQDTEKPAEQAGKEFGGTFGKALSGIVSTAIVATATVAIGGLSLALTKGFSRLTNIENATAKLEGLGHSADSVKIIMDSALASVLGTAYGLDTAATLAASAVAAGIKPGEELTRYLTLTADAATIAGVSLGEMGDIMNRIGATGKATNNELMMLANRGIPIYDMLAESMGVSREEVRNLATQGKIDLETFQLAIEENMAGAALKSGDTTVGALANVQAALGRVGANILKPAEGMGLFSMLGDLLRGTISALKPVEQKAREWGMLLENNIRPVFDRFMEFLPNAGQMFEDLGKKLEGTGPLFAVLGGALLPMTSSLPLIGKFLPAVTGPMGIFIGLLGALLAASPELREALGALGSEVMGALAQAFEQIGPVLSDLVGTFTEIAVVIGGALAEVILMLIPVILDLIEALVPVIVNILPPLADLFLVLSQVMGDVAVLLITSLMPIVILLVDIFIALVEVLVPIVTALLPPFLKILYLLYPILEIVLDVFLPIVELVLPLFVFLLELLTPLLIFLADVIANVLIAAIEWLVDLFHWASEGTSSFADAVRNAWENYIKPALEAIGNFFMAIWNNFLKPVFMAIMFAFALWIGIVNLIWQNVIRPVLGFIGEAFQAMWERFIRPVIDFIVGAITRWWDTVTTLYYNYIQPIFEMIGSVFNWIWSEVVEPIINWVVGAFEFLWERTEAIFNAVADFMREVWQRMIQYVRGPVNIIIGFINRLIDALNSIQIDIPSWVPIYGGQKFGIKIPKVPLLADGGVLQSSGTVMVGEAGPELLTLPAGARVTPLDKAGSGKTIIYNAAPNQSLTSEEELFLAMRRARLVAQW
jgi:tape measure domain-containing protein